MSSIERQFESKFGTEEKEEAEDDLSESTFREISRLIYF